MPRTNLATTPRPGKNLGRYIPYGTVGSSYAEGEKLRIDLPSLGDRGQIHPALTLSPGTYYATVTAQTGASATNAAFVVKRQADQGLLLERHLTTPGSTSRIGGAFTLTSTTVVEMVFAQGAYSGLSQGSVWFWEVLLEASAVEGTFFDGDTPDTPTTDYGWVGTAQDSVSTAAMITVTPGPVPGSGATDTALEAQCRGVWEGIKHRYIRADGGVMQRQSPVNIITSEGQGYAALQAVALDDWATFDLVESFSTNVLERKNNSDAAVRAKGTNLMAWKYYVDPWAGSPANSIGDWGWASDGDIDRAKALFWSGVKRNRVADTNKALAIMSQLRDFGFNTAAGKSYQGTDQWQKSSSGFGHHHNAAGDSVMEINPSYIDPSTYHLAKDIGNDAFWGGALLGAWDVWTKDTDNVAPLATTTGLFTNWTSWNLTTFTASHMGASPDGWSYDHGGTEDDIYTYDAFRAPIRAVWSYDWYKDSQVPTILAPLKAFYASEWAAHGVIYPEYNHDGTAHNSSYEGSIFYVAAVMVLTCNDPSNSTAAAIRSTKLNPTNQYGTDADGFKFWKSGPSGGSSSYFADFWSNFYYLRQAGLWQNFGQTTAPTGSVTLDVTDVGDSVDSAEFAVTQPFSITDVGDSIDSVQFGIVIALTVNDVGDSLDFADLSNNNVPIDTAPPPLPAIKSARARWLWITPAGETIELTNFVNDTEVLKGMTGYGAPPSVIRRETVPGQPGGRTRAVRHGVREIGVPMFALGKSVLGLDVLLARLIRATDPWRGEGILRRIDTFGNESDLYCRCTSGLEGRGSGANGPSNLRVMPIFQAEDPYFYREAKTQGFSGAEPRSFFPILPLRLTSASVIGDIKIRTESDVPTWPVWTLMGPGSNAVLRNNTTGEVFSLDMDLGHGEAVIIDCRPYQKLVIGPNGSTTAPDGSKYFGKLVQRNLWALHPGLNEVSLGLDGATSASYVSVSYRDRVLVPIGATEDGSDDSGGGGGDDGSLDLVTDLVEGIV